jgi:DNA-binding transcriptional LysR family regulator
MLGLANTLRQEAADARGMKAVRCALARSARRVDQVAAEILQRYRQVHPGIEVHIDEGPDRQVLQWLEERRIDVGFVVLPEERFRHFRAGRRPDGCAAPARSSTGRQRGAEPGFVCRPFCTDRGRFSGTGLRACSLPRACNPNIRYRCSQLLSTLDVVSRGDAVTVVAEGSLPDDPAPCYVKNRCRRRCASDRPRCSRSASGFAGHAGFIELAKQMNQP